ncbi:ubiquitin-like-specific protease ESD4 [Polypterus senegalus]|uniref:ubiquitin-like-specific protease ESD4 n=1 Tax=Polypterus senegalus TaxID=55291 RepID=UPI001964C813|nr:ubiquitin-like-specific protease ESD4 [Polypterus senegalus]
MLSSSPHGIQVTGLCVKIASKIMPGSWKEPQNKNLPKQIDSLDCGIFMLMYALYIAIGRAFDFSQEDMPKIRRWWCLLLLHKGNMKSQDIGLHFPHEKKDIQCTTGSAS